MGPSRSSTAHLDGLGTFSLDRIESWLPGFHRAMSLHPSRCNGYVTAQHNKPARHIWMTRLALATAFLLLALAAPAAAQEETPPNLLIVMTAAQRADGVMTVMPQTRRKIGAQGTTYANVNATTHMSRHARAAFHI